MPQFGRGKPAAGAFYDSDFSTIDDVLAVALLFGLQNSNDCRVAVLTMSRPNLQVAGFVDTVERFYHGPAGNFAQVPPIGMRSEGAAGETSAAFTTPFQKRKPDGAPVYVNEVKSVIDTADPVTLIRNYLPAQQDQNGFFVLAGPATNLAALLKEPGIQPIITAKLKQLVIAAGALGADVPAAKKLFAEWPTPIVLVGADVGAALEFPGASIDKEFAQVVPDHPIADAYRAYRKMPYDAPSTALAAALFAARPADDFTLSAPGTIAIDDAGRTSFTPAEKGTHRCLTADPQKKEAIVQSFVALASARPASGRRGGRGVIAPGPPPPAKKN